MQNDFWSPLQEVIKRFCVAYDHKWQIRKRVIDTHLLVLFIFKLVLSKNQQGYKSLLIELWENKELSIYQKNPISASSLSEARQKLPEEVFIELNTAILFHQEKISSLPTWFGHRVFAVDGSKLNLPHELLLAGYKAPNRDQYYPQGLMSAIYHLGSGLIYDCLLSSNKSERHCLIDQMNKLSPDDVLVLDRGYFSYLILHQAIEKGIHLVCRLQFGTMNKEVKAFFDSDSNDAIIKYYPSAAVKSEIKKQGYQINYKTIDLRLIKYQIGNEKYICATTLIDKKYPQEEFSRVYHGRWGIEELYKISKEFINIEDFHSRTERGVKQELYAHVLLINIARIFELEANNQLSQSTYPQKKDKIKESYWKDLFGKIQMIKINFKNCLLVVGRYIEKIIMTVEECQESWLPKMLNSISRIHQKIRPGRHYPRQSRKPYTRWQSSNASKTVKA